MIFCKLYFPLQKTIIFNHYLQSSMWIKLPEGMGRECSDFLGSLVSNVGQPNPRKILLQTVLIPSISGKQQQLPLSVGLTQPEKVSSCVHSSTAQSTDGFSSPQESQLKALKETVQLCLSSVLHHQPPTVDPISPRAAEELNSPSTKGSKAPWPGTSTKVGFLP